MTSSQDKQQAREDYEIRPYLWFLDEVCRLVGIFMNLSP